MNALQPSARVHGLDTLRALAIGFVVLHNYELFASHGPVFGWAGAIGWTGVDLFFALSGYLIGNQIFAALRSEQGFSLKHFYARRLLRTLPNYYAMLALYFLWPAFRDHAPLPPLWKFLTFTQNIALEPGTAFSHAWSLCIEEQFYMLLPAAALLIAASRRKLAWAWIAVGLAFATGMAVRGYLWLHLVDGQPHGIGDFYEYIYYSSACRFDELTAGVALALLKNYHAGAWRRLTAHGGATLAAGIALTGLTFWLFLAHRFGFAMTVFGYPMLALGFALLVVSALSGGSLLGAMRIPGAASLALWSYAIYLTHKQVCILASEQLAALGYRADAPPAILAMLVLSVFSGWLLYRLVEAPFMALRRRLVPTNAAQPESLRPQPR